MKLHMHSHNRKLINATKISTKEKLTLHGVTVLKITTHNDTMQNRAFFPVRIKKLTFLNTENPAAATIYIQIQAGSPNLLSLKFVIITAKLRLGHL
jgi:hypothetical protein